MSKKDKWLDNDGVDAQVASLLAERNTFKEKVAALVVERTRLRVKVGKLTAERDRYREALEEIAKCPCECEWDATCDPCCARNALSLEKGTER